MAIMWLNENSGAGFGVTRVGNMFAQATMEPKEYNKETGRFDDDWPSIVAVIGPPEKYTEEEVAKLEAFGARQTARYDEMFRWRMGCNLIIIGKSRPDWWLRKRQSWDMGPMYSPTLDEALAIFND